jgi:hypothetical protein
MVSCGSQKETASAEEMAKLEELVNSKSFRLNARWANPMATQGINAVAASGLLPPGSTPNRIDIIGTASYLEVKNDSGFAILPYFGERQFGSTYNPQDVGIQFKGVPKDFEIEYNEKKQRYEMEFDIINEQGEGFNINATLFPNLNTIFYINSNERRTIGYSGTMNKIPE